MEDTTLSITGIIIAAIIMFIVPLVMIADRNDDISQLLVETYTAEFVDDIIKKGEITNEDYEQYLISLGTSGNTYDVNIELKILDENPGRRHTNVTGTTGENSYYSLFTSQIEEELNTVTEKQKKQQELFEKRIVAIYEAGETQYLDIILKSRNLSEFLSSYYVISEIAETDKELLEDLTEKKKTIDLTKQKLENEKKELATIMENQTRMANTLQNTKQMRQNFISKLSEDEKNLQSKIDEINAQYEEVNKQILELAQQGLDTAYIGGELAWPVPGYTRITSKYAMRVHPITGQYKLHTGVDIGAPTGANFIAANDGVVVKAGMNTAYGNMVIIDHGGGISTLYAHGSEILVQVGQQVKRGDPVLKVGSTGYSTGPHAHFEVRINGVTTDPLPYITNGLIPGEENKEENTNTLE